ncbi:hypothetical protein [Nocardia amamiensis]|uniref:hypothetical protein n=1 Tax=Nocardia amamiensis TaxID=404578 RepID=UPI001E48FE55|nr:hypothetical protein [Nocardia amamiensis]
MEHELADCLWSILILGHRYEVDIEAAFTKAMGELKDVISTRLADRAPGRGQQRFEPQMRKTECG